MNLGKSSISFSMNTKTEVRAKICSVLEVNEGGEARPILGYQNFWEQTKIIILGFLKENIRERIQSWEGKFLSKAGKELLLKTLAQSLPRYAMNVFLLPLEMCREMEQMMCKYWWK